MSAPSPEHELTVIETLPELDPETAAIIAIERALAELDMRSPKAANSRAASTRVLAYLAERHKLIGTPGRKPRVQGGS